MAQDGTMRGDTSRNGNITVGSVGDGSASLQTVEKDSAEIRRGVRHAHGAFIREMMERMDETDTKRSQVAAAIGDSPTMSARAFNLNENITLRTMVRNAMALGCDVDIKLVPKK